MAFAEKRLKVRYAEKQLERTLLAWIVFPHHIEGQGVTGGHDQHRATGQLANILKAFQLKEICPCPENQMQVDPSGKVSSRGQQPSARNHAKGTICTH